VRQKRNGRLDVAAPGNAAFAGASVAAHAAEALRDARIAALHGGALLPLPDAAAAILPTDDGGTRAAEDAITAGAAPEDPALRNLSVSGEQAPLALVAFEPSAAGSRALRALLTRWRTAVRAVAAGASATLPFVDRLALPKAKIGTFDVELTSVFFEGFARGAQCNLHVRKIEGDILHHVVECTFKSFARALRDAVRVEGTTLPSTKGTLTE